VIARTMEEAPEEETGEAPEVPEALAGPADAGDRHSERE